jgi:flagellar secretion chaperone FliS
MAAQDARYLESKVLTAPPQRLHLMLIEGAIRFARQAEHAITSGDPHGAEAALLRVIEITGELLAGTRGRKSDLNDRMSQLYWFLFRRATEAKINFNAFALADVLRLLEYERETWQMLCERLPDSGSRVDHRHSPASANQHATHGAPHNRGLSIEA